MENNFIDDNNEENEENLVNQVNVVTSQMRLLDEQQVISWCYDGRHLESFQYLFSFYHYLTKDPVLKESVFNLIMYIILNVKKPDIESILEKLDNDQLDILMRYIYKGLEHPVDGRSNHLFFWHSAIFEKTGPGSIVRMLCDKRKI